MTDVLATETQKMTREQIAAIVGGNPRAIALIESLIRDVAVTIPAAVDEVQYSALFSLHGADGSKQAAQHAQQMTAELQALESACQRAAADLAAMRREIEMLRTEMSDVRSRIMSTITQVQAQASQALILSIGV